MRKLKFQNNYYTNPFVIHPKLSASGVYSEVHTIKC